MNRSAEKKRPSGIGTLAILQAISGFIILILGFISISILPAVGGLLILYGMFSIFIADGLWKGKGWAWILCIISAGIGIIWGLVNLPGGIVYIIVNLLIIYYLTQPNIKAFFGKAIYVSSNQTSPE